MFQVCFPTIWKWTETNIVGVFIDFICIVTADKFCFSQLLKKNIYLSFSTCYFDKELSVLIFSVSEILCLEMDVVALRFAVKMPLLENVTKSKGKHMQLDSLLIERTPSRVLSVEFWQLIRRVILQRLCERLPMQGRIQNLVEHPR